MSKRNNRSDASISSTVPAGETPDVAGATPPVDIVATTSATSDATDTTPTDREESAQSASSPSIAPDTTSEPQTPAVATTPAEPTEPSGVQASDAGGAPVGGEPPKAARPRFFITRPNGVQEETDDAIRAHNARMLVGAKVIDLRTGKPYTGEAPREPKQ
jgi:hypothetical protein